MAKYQLNFGLKIGRTNDQMSYDKALHLVQQHFPVYQHEHQPATGPDDEDTLVAIVDSHPMMVNAKMHDLSQAGQQDAVAYRNEDTKVGALAGPKAKDWGTFNPQFFKTI